ncbi:hypothetical protein Tco_0924591 [Tanacetum coccineum]|uniref:Uncharacterized protein n=1 Tax=Tanacetum coccineum TaxID=301880 RepID=A0ABQ5D716_9ASTR
MSHGSSSSQDVVADSRKAGEKSSAVAPKHVSEMQTQYYLNTGAILGRWLSHTSSVMVYGRMGCVVLDRVWWRQSCFLLTGHFMVFRCKARWQSPNDDSSISLNVDGTMRRNNGVLDVDAQEPTKLRLRDDILSYQMMFDDVTGRISIVNFEYDRVVFPMNVWQISHDMAVGTLDYSCEPDDVQLRYKLLVKERNSNGWEGLVHVHHWSHDADSFPDVSNQLDDSD